MSDKPRNNLTTNRSKNTRRRKLKKPNKPVPPPPVPEKPAKEKIPKRPKRLRSTTGYLNEIKQNRDRSSKDYKTEKTQENKVAPKKQQKPKIPKLKKPNKPLPKLPESDKPQWKRAKKPLSTPKEAKIIIGTRKSNITPQQIKELQKLKRKELMQERTATNPLGVRKVEFEEAEKYFKKNPNATKFAAKVKLGKNKIVERGFSFIKMNDGNIYAIGNKEVGQIYKQGLSKVVKAQNEQGKVFALKISSIETFQDIEIQKESIKSEENYLQKFDKLVSTTDRKIGKNEKLSGIISEKHFSLMNLEKGEDLSKFINKNKDIDIKTKLKIGLKLIEELKKLHKINIIHRDIKPANFMIQIDDGKVNVSIIDFDVAFNLGKFKRTVNTNQGVGTFGYDTPDKKKGKSVYSKASDLYALGKVFEELGIPQDICDQMTETKKHKRASLYRVEKELNKARRALEHTGSSLENTQKKFSRKTFLTKFNQKPGKIKEHNITRETLTSEKSKKPNLFNRPRKKQDKKPYGLMLFNCTSQSKHTNITGTILF